MPRRVDDHILHLVREFGAATVLVILADHGAGGERDLVIVENPRAEIREIDEDVPPTPLFAQPAFPFHGNDHRFEPLARGRVERRKSRRPRNAILFKPVIGLEGLHGLLQPHVIGLRRAAREITHCNQTVAQGNDCRTTVTGAQFLRGHRRPPAAVGDQVFKTKFLLEQPGIFIALRRKVAHFARGIAGQNLGQKRPCFTPCNLALDVADNLRGDQNPRLHIPRIAQIGKAQCHFDLSQIALRPRGAHGCHHPIEVVALRRQTMHPCPRQDLNQGLTPRKVLCSVTRPDRAIRLFLIKGRQITILGCRLCHGLPKGRLLCRSWHNPCKQQEDTCQQDHKRPESCADTRLAKCQEHFSTSKSRDRFVKL